VLYLHVNNSQSFGVPPEKQLFRPAPLRALPQRIGYPDWVACFRCFRGILGVLIKIKATNKTDTDALMCKKDQIISGPP